MRGETPLGGPSILREATKPALRHLRASSDKLCWLKPVKFGGDSLPLENNLSQNRTFDLV